MQFLFVGKELKMEGFMVNRWSNRWDEGVEQNLQWIREVTKYFKAAGYCNICLYVVELWKNSECILLLVKNPRC
jgi:hypothetical protein